VPRFADRVIAVAPGAVHLFDGVAGGAGQAGLGRRVVLGVEVGAAEGAAEERHRIVAGGAERVAAREPSKGEDRASSEAVTLDRLAGVHRAGRLVSAGARQEGRDRRLVETERRGGRAVSILNLDDPMPPAALDEIRAMPDIVVARLVKL